MIVLEVTESNFIDLMGEDFSYEASAALYEYYDDLSDSMEEPFQFDRVVIRSAWDEFETALEAYNYHHGEDDEGVGTSVGEDNTEENAEEQALEWLQDNTAVLEFDGGVLVEVF